jgi:hypothetical protein
MTRPDLKGFLVHEDGLVRDSVSFRFFDSWSKDGDLAPLTLEACRRFGEEATLNLLSFGCRFYLSSRGLVDALRALAESHPPFVEQWVSLAPIELVEARSDLVRSVVSFRTRTRLQRRTSFRRMVAAELWRRLDALSRRLDSRAAGPRDWDEREDLVEAVAAVERKEAVCERTARLQEVDSPYFRGALVELAAAMDPQGAPELLVALLGSPDEGLARVAARALAKCEEAAVVRCIRMRYPTDSRRFRRLALRVLRALPSSESERVLHQILESEHDPAHRGRIFDGLRFRFSPESSELLRRELEEKSSAMIGKEIRKALYVFDRILGADESRWRSYRAELDARGEAEVYFHIPFLDRA